MVGTNAPFEDILWGLFFVKTFWGRSRLFQPFSGEKQRKTAKNTQDRFRSAKNQIFMAEPAETDFLRFFVSADLIHVLVGASPAPRSPHTYN